jgi:Restriction endonuclease EcoRII, N-terminal/Domain of unknown function (DUF3883)
MQIFRRKLTKNDVGEAGNQSGFFVPKAQARAGFFPVLDESMRDNPRAKLPTIDEASGQMFELNFIYYNKRNDEFRVTAVKELFALYRLRAGDEILLRREGDTWLFSCRKDRGDHEVDQLINPQHLQTIGQGRGGSSADRRAVELHAMLKAKDWLKANGFGKIEDYSNSQSYDFSASRGGRVWKIEVKGTTALKGDSVLMTVNEVELHRAEKGSTVIIIVYGISLARVAKVPVASGGRVWAEVGWNIDSWIQTPTAFRVSRNS